MPPARRVLSRLGAARRRLSMRTRHRSTDATRQAGVQPPWGGPAPADHRPMAAKLRHVSSRANPLVKELRRLAHEPGAYRKLGRVWLEGGHLCRALLARGLVPEEAVVTEAGWADAAVCGIAAQAPNVTVVDEASMRDISGLEIGRAHV